MIFRLRLLQFLIFVLPSVGLAQIEKSRIYNISSDEGLMSDEVETVFQDSYGFLWIGAFDGLTRYDGHEFKKYRYSESDSNSLGHNIIYTIFEDSKQRLWIGTIGGIHLYNREKDNFINLHLKNTTNERIPVNKIIEDSKHHLWLGTSWGLCYFNPDNFKEQWFTGESNNPHTLSNDVIFSLAIDKEDNLWIATYAGGVCKYNPKSKKFDRFDCCGSIKIKKIYVDHSGKIWVGTYDNGLYVLNKEGKLIKEYPINDNSKDLILCIYQDKNNVIWVGQYNQTLCYLDNKTDRFISFTNTAFKKNQVSCKSISDIFEDNFGDIWFASYENGLLYSNSYKNNFDHMYYREGNKNQLPEKVITSMHEDKLGNIWMGTKGGGISKFDPKNNTYTNYNENNGLKSNAIHEIKEDENGKLWIATWGGGIASFDPVKNIFTNYLHNPSDINSLVNNNVKTILPDDSLIWIGTHGEGIAVLNIKTNKFIHYKNNKIFNFNMYDPTWINHMFKDAKGRIWVGCFGGLFLIEKNKCSRFNRTNKKGSISHNDINMIMEDSKGRIWIATEGGGLNLFHEKDRSFTKAGHQQIPQSIKAITSDEKGIIWIAGTEGLISFDPDSEKVSSYTVRDGLQSNFFFHKAVLKTKSGKLFFGGINGVNGFYPQNISRPKSKSKIYLTNLYIFDQLQIPGDKSSALSKSIQFCDTIILNHNQSFFSIAFTHVNLPEALPAQYSYYMEGLENHWINIQSERKVSFTDLAPGKYRFKIRYSMDGGQWQEAEKKIMIIVLPPWYNTIWFKILAGASVLIIISFAFFQRIYSVKRKNLELEKEVSKRTQELVEANSVLTERNEEVKIQNEKLEIFNEEITRQKDRILTQQEQILKQNHELETNVDELKTANATKDRFFSILAHDLKNPVGAIKSLSQLILKHGKNLSPEEITEMIENLHKSSITLDTLISNLLDWARSQNGQIKSQPVSFRLKGVADRVFDLLEAQAMKKNISINNQIDSDFFVYADLQMIETVVRNLVSNSIKFSTKGSDISLITENNHSYITLKISDNGVGMTEDQVKNLFKLNNQQNTNGTNGERGTGLGLQICRDFIEINKGSIGIKSEINKGTVVTINLPKQAIMEDKVKESEKENLVPSITTINSDDLKLINGKKVLIIEDDPATRNYLRHFLSRNVEIIEAENGEEGISKAEQIQPDLVISDIEMPVMNGLEFCERLKSNPITSHIPFILLTSHDTDEIQLSGYKAGSDIYLSKPVKENLLLQVIINLIKKQKEIRLQIFQSKEILPSDLPFNKTEEEFLKSVVEIIEENISNPNLDAEMICKHTALSRSVLYSKFKTIMGLGVHELIRNVRLKKSIQFLAEGKLSVNEIAYEVGFNSPSYYIRCFSKEFGKPPKEYIESLKKKEK